MEALKKVVETSTDNLILQVPLNFRNRKLEVIIFPLEDPFPEGKKRFEKFLQNPIEVEEIAMPSREERNAR